MDVFTVFPKYQVVIPKRVREQFDLKPGQGLQVIALPGRIELAPSRPAVALRGFLEGENTFERESDRLRRKSIRLWIPQDGLRCLPMDLRQSVSLRFFKTNIL